MQQLKIDKVSKREEMNCDYGCEKFAKYAIQVNGFFQVIYVCKKAELLKELTYFTDK